MFTDNVSQLFTAKISDLAIQHPLMVPTALLNFLWLCLGTGSTWLSHQVILLYAVKHPSYIHLVRQIQLPTRVIAKTTQFASK